MYKFAFWLWLAWRSSTLRRFNAFKDKSDAIWQRSFDWNLVSECKLFVFLKLWRTTTSVRRSEGLTGPKSEHGQAAPFKFSSHLAGLETCECRYLLVWVRSIPDSLTWTNEHPNKVSYTIHGVFWCTEPLQYRWCLTKASGSVIFRDGAWHGMPENVPELSTCAAKNIWKSVT